LNLAYLLELTSGTLRLVLLILHSKMHTLTKPSLLASNGAPVDAPPEVPTGKPSSPVDMSAFESQEPRSNAPVSAIQGGVIENKNIVRRKLTGYVGFANLPNQWHRKSVRKGFNFNVMVVGTYCCILLRPRDFQF